MFTCASSAERLTRRLSHGIPQKWQENGVYSIGTACTEKLRKLGYEKVVQPQTPGVQELCEIYIRQKRGK
jgi:uroporphyrinogen-III synthase